MKAYAAEVLGRSLKFFMISNYELNPFYYFIKERRLSFRSTQFNSVLQKESERLMILQSTRKAQLSWYVVMRRNLNCAKSLHSKKKKKTYKENKKRPIGDKLRVSKLGVFDTQYDVINDTYNHKDFNLEDEDHNKKKGPFVLRSVFEDRCEAFLDIGQIE